MLPIAPPISSGALLGTMLQTTNAPMFMFFEGSAWQNHIYGKMCDGVELYEAKWVAGAPVGSDLANIA